MAGSRNSPLLRDQWSAPSETRDQRERGRQRPRGSNRDRGRDRFRDRERRRRSKGNGPIPPLRSPPPSRSQPQSELGGPRSYREISPNNTSPRGSSGLPYSEARQRQNQDHRQFVDPQPLEGERPTGRDYRRDNSPSAPPPFKRKRTQSPSPVRPFSPRQDPSHHHPASEQFDEFDRGYPHKKRGRYPGRGRARRRSPRRGRDRRRKESDRFKGLKSPLRGPRSPRHPRERYNSPDPADDIDQEYHHRSPSRYSINSAGSRFSATSRHSFRVDATMNPRPIQSAMNNSFRSSSPPRPVPSFNAEITGVPTEGDPNARETFPFNGERALNANDNQRSHPSRLQADTSQYSTSPKYGPSSNSYQGSPQSTSPHPGGRGGLTGQSPHQRPRGSSHSSPYRQSNYPSQGGSQDQFNQGQAPPTGPANHPQSYSGPSYRGGHSGYRGNSQNHGRDQRFSGSGHSSYNTGPSGRGRFNSFQWNARGGGGSVSPHTTHPEPSQSPAPLPAAGEQSFSGEEDRDQAFGSPSRDLQTLDQGSKPCSEDVDFPKISRPTQPSDTNATPNKGGKFSFAFKAKTTPAPAPKPVPDLAQRMQAREPPPRVAEPARSRVPLGPPPRFKPEPRFDRRDRDRDRDRHRNRERDRGRRDRRDFRRDPRDYREPRDIRDNRKEDRRFDQRHVGRKEDRRQDPRPPRGPRERSPGVKQPQVLTRPKPRPTLPEEYAKSDSVYYRKPGNESVIGAGTYGKVFKAIHVYTQRKVALKKIRMEGEKDGFPVTAVREIKLLQHLRNHNVVSLLEVMVERNECFMVFEYLSHDLTGLINHPTFTLTAAHKKDLAKQMFDGLNYLHHRGVLHRDIKAANILISNRGLLKFADFGLARFFSKSRQLDYTNRVITIWYRPPELLLGETRYGPAVDVWSAGCVFVELFTKKAVFPGEGGEISQLEKLYASLGTPTRAEWPDLVEMPWFELMRPTERKKRVFEDIYREVLSPAALDLVSQIFRYDPTKRPSAEEVLTHPYFVSEEPAPQQAIELENIEGDWHEFESKALRKEKDKEARRAEYQKDKEKRKAALSAPQSERETKRVRQDVEENLQPSAQPVEQ
ncbi:hypothetical protein KXV55_007167 [Aspergillus fumigatus]|nr:hypothetical protein KXW10_004206 [Aspergillus fumigatus]KAH3528221.1 hypothetical protein KXV55_007167 [Aspergillus fumigatus]